MTTIDDLMELADCYAIKVYNLASPQYCDQEGKDAARAALLKEMKALVQDALDYRYLRSKHWNEGGLCVVDNKDDRCIYVGTYCPSGDLLDKAIAEERGDK